jgi:hypothetical protein
LIAADGIAARLVHSDAPCNWVETTSADIVTLLAMCDEPVDCFESYAASEVR